MSPTVIIGMINMKSKPIEIQRFIRQLADQTLNKFESKMSKLTIDTFHPRERRFKHRSVDTLGHHVRGDSFPSHTLYS